MSSWGAAVRPRAIRLAIVSFTVAFAGAAAARADNTSLMVIVPPPGSQVVDFATTYPTRALTFTIEYDDTYYQGDMIQCRLDSGITPPGQGYPTITEGPWGSCGSPALGTCPLSQCFRYSPPLTSDAQYTILTRLIGTDGTQEGGAGTASFDFSVDSTPPNTHLRIGYFGTQSPTGDGRHAMFTFSSDDPSATFQCAVGFSPVLSGPWKRCSSDANIPFALPVTTRTQHYGVRAVDVFGRVDPSPPTYAFTTIPCRARVLTHARTLAALVKGIRVRITCVTPSAWHFLILPESRLGRRLALELGGYTGVFRRAGQSRTITVHAFPLSSFPPQFARDPLPIAYVTEPSTDVTEGFGAPQRIRGRLAPSR